MTMYVYSTGGEPVGFLSGTFIHDLSGAPLGRILGSRVHRLDGLYVGEWFQGTVVEKSGISRPPIAPLAVPPHQPSPGSTFKRRVVVDYGFPDRFDMLQSAGDPMSIAAE